MLWRTTASRSLARDTNQRTECVGGANIPRQIGIFQNPIWQFGIFLTRLLIDAECFFSGLLYLANDWRYTLGRFHSTKSHPSVCIDPISLIQLLTRLLYTRRKHQCRQTDRSTWNRFSVPLQQFLLPAVFSRLIYFHPLCSIGFVSLRFFPLHVVLAAQQDTSPLAPTCFRRAQKRCLSNYCTYSPTLLLYSSGLFLKKRKPQESIYCIMFCALQDNR